MQQDHMKLREFVIRSYEEGDLDVHSALENLRRSGLNDVEAYQKLGLGLPSASRARTLNNTSPLAPSNGVTVKRPTMGPPNGYLRRPLPMNAARRTRI